MGAYLGFDTKWYFDENETEDFIKAEDYFKEIIKYKDRNDDAISPAYHYQKLLDRLRICYDGKIYEIRKSNPKLVLLPDEEQSIILEDIKGLYMKYEYQNPKYYFIYDFQTFMLPEYPQTLWYDTELLHQKFSPSVGFMYYISLEKLDATTRKIIKMSERHRLVVTFSI